MNIRKLLSTTPVTLFIIAAAGCATTDNKPNLDLGKKSSVKKTAESAFFYEESENLNFGFRLLRYGVKNGPGSFEGIRHGSSLYFRDRKIGSAGTFSISPSGKYLLFLDYDSNAKIMVFRSGNSTTTPLTSTFVGSPEKYLWNESKESIMVTFYDGKPTLTFSLSEKSR